MNASDLDNGAFALGKGQVAHLCARRGQRLEALSGWLWTTTDNDLRDVIVSPGHGYTVERSGHLLISATVDTRWMLLTPQWPRAACPAD